MLSWTTDDLVWTVDLKRRASNSLENWQTSLNINSLSSRNLLRLFLHYHPLGSATLWVGTRSPCQPVIEIVSKMRLKKATNFNNNQRTWDHLRGGKQVNCCRLMCSRLQILLHYRPNASPKQKTVYCVTNMSFKDSQCFLFGHSGCLSRAAGSMLGSAKTFTKQEKKSGRTKAALVSQWIVDEIKNLLHFTATLLLTFPLFAQH